MTTQHGLPEDSKEQTFSKSLISGLNMWVMAKAFDKVIAVSNSLKSFFIDQHGFDCHKVIVIRNGIEIIGIDGVIDANDSFTVGSSGRLFPVKDFFMLVEIARLLSSHEEIAFTLAGEGPEREVLENGIEAYDLGERVNLRGHLDDMHGFYSDLSVYLNTSLHEGIPMAILEAMAHGLPIIAPKVGGIPEIINDGVEGFLIEGRNPADFAEKCLLLSQDQALRQKMSMAAHERVLREFSAAKMADSYLQCYRDLAS